MKIKWLFISLLLLLLGGCSNNIIENDTTITRIEMMKFAGVSPSPDEYRKQDGEIISVIKSDEKIQRIVKSIKKAKQESTENRDIALPNYLIIFKEGKNVVLTLGYYPNINNSKDKFLDISEDKMYTTKALNLIRQE
ncbi:hypothetical protein [Neobacillus niacini]|uniref:hypothetical protein n=1 Tax=Neobacillus niacini TaxID=86668 RepID=UPI00398389D9